MHITAGVVLLAVLASGARGTNSGNARPARTDKRALAEGNASLEKRTAELNSSPQTPGIEYAESKETELDKSPAQQVYSTQRPSTVSKVSDVLSGQQGPVPAAIASQLYSPVQLYHGRASAGVPTTYELSAPVASQLAYSEHNVYLEPQSNTIQYNTQPQKAQTQGPNLPVTRFTFNYPQQPITYVQQPIFYQQPQQQLPQQIFQSTPQINYNQQHLEYIRSQAPQVFIQPAQPGIVYAQKGSDVAAQPNYAAQQAPREVKIAPPAKVVEKTTLEPLQAHTDKPSGAVSFASFSQSQPTSNYIPTSNNYVQVNPKLEAPHNNPQIQKQAPLTLYVSKAPVRYYPQPQLFQDFHSPQLYQPEPQLHQQPHFYPQTQFHAQPQLNGQPQLHSQPQLHPQPQLNAQFQLHSQPQFHTQPQLNAQPQLHSKPQLHAQPQLHPQPQLNVQPQFHSQPQRPFLQNSLHSPQQYIAVPTFPPVQYFGKFAPQLFGNYQH